jgi:hypothetical protein
MSGARFRVTYCKVSISIPQHTRGKDAVPDIPGFGLKTIETDQVELSSGRRGGNVNNENRAISTKPRNACVRKS